MASIMNRLHSFSLLYRNMLKDKEQWQPKHLELIQVDLKHFISENLDLRR